MTSDGVAERDRLRYALGDLVIAFSEVELRLRQLVWVLLDLDDARGSTVTSALSFGMLQRVARQFWDAKGFPEFELDEAGAAKYNAKTATEWLFRELPSAEASRNTMLHSWWPDPSEPHWWPHALAPFDEEGKALRWKSASRTGQLFPTAVPIFEIENLAGDFYELAQGLAVMVGMAMGASMAKATRDA